MSETYGPIRESSDVSAEVDLREVESALRRIELAGYNIRPVFMASRKALRADIKAHRRSQSGPDSAWAPLAASTTMKRRARPGKQGRKRRKPPRPIGKVLGRLPGAFDIKIGPHTMRAISRVKWSGVHQSGGRAGKRAQIRAREFLWLSKLMVVTVAIEAADFMRKAWEGRL